jgi:flagellar basal body-associated protein FliL
MANVIFIRNLSKEDNDCLQELKVLFAVKTNSQAALKAIRRCIKLKEQNESLSQKLEEYKTIIREQDKILNDIRGAMGWSRIFRKKLT